MQIPNHPHPNDRASDALLKNRRVIFARNTSRYLYSHQLHTLKAFLGAGCEVFTLTPDDAFADNLAEAGCRTLFLPMVPSSKNPLREALTAAAFLRVYRKVRPHAAFHYTIKCNLYGGFAAASLGIPYINNVCGLGSAFASEGPLNRLARTAYRLTQRRAAQVFFQSPADLEYMRDRDLVTETQALLLPGSGVDLERFHPVQKKPARGSGGVVFVYAGRLLREKGFTQLAEAMRRIKAIAPDAVCRVHGFLEPGDSRFLSREELARWEAEGLLEYRGPLEDVRPAYADADCAVLPSYYREGIPKSLLEAAAMGLPIVATSLAGCRAVVRDGVNGFLCEPRDAASLADAMLRMLTAGAEGRARMGWNGREIAEAAFGEERVSRAYLDAARGLVRERERNGRSGPAVRYQRSENTSAQRQ